MHNYIPTIYDNHQIYINIMVVPPVRLCGSAPEDSF